MTSMLIGFHPVVSAARNWPYRIVHRSFTGTTETSYRRTIQLYGSLTKRRLCSAAAPVEQRVDSTNSGFQYAGQTSQGLSQRSASESIRKFSPILLRDLCQCSACLDPSTKQKLFSTADIPADIAIDNVTLQLNQVYIKWRRDLPGYDASHTTRLEDGLLQQINGLASADRTELLYKPPTPVTWEAEAYRQLPDIEYDAYMQDDGVLFQALQQLHTHGLMFLTGVPESENSVSIIAERIGPVKNTFYGYTWDVRSIPEAKNVAYTSQDLGFHMDLLYMHQPPHIQLLHCIRSSSSGGASLFTDSLRAAVNMYSHSFENFRRLAHHDVTFHYHHASSQLYRQSRPVFELAPKTPGRPSQILDQLSAINWSPPFQGPFEAHRQDGERQDDEGHTSLSSKVDDWHPAAQEFSRLIHRPGGTYDRLMKPGECVIFNNRRVLHARRAFDVADAGKERWLRGAYLDEDPFLSKTRVLAAALE